MMNRLEQIQILYEITMSIDRSLGYKELMETTLSKYLRKLNCSLGAVFELKEKDGVLSFQKTSSIPKRVRSNSISELRT